MRATQRAALIAIVMTALLAPLGCEGDTADEDAPPKDENTLDDAKGAPLNRDDEEVAPGSPLDIPAVTQAVGRPVDSVQDELEGEIRKKCDDGTLCITVTTEARDPNYTTCRYTGTDPKLPARLYRGNVIVLITGTKSIEEETDPECHSDATNSDPATPNSEPEANSEPDGEGGVPDGGVPDDGVPDGP
jgi:hypothetical protein